MHLTIDQHYAASVADVGRMLADEDFVRWRAAQISGPSGSVELVNVTGSADQAFTVATRRTVATEQIPPQVRQVVGATLQIRHTEAWEAELGGRRTGTVTMEIAGAPVRFIGAVTLGPGANGGCVQIYHGEIRTMVPLFGSALEDAAATSVRAALAGEERCGRAWLAGDVRPFDTP